MTSARQPFSFHAGAPATPLTFVADPSNPLNGGPVAANPKERVENAENAPLNIESLTKGNRAQNSLARRQSMQAPPRPSTSDPHSMSAPANHHIIRPGTSDPHSKPKSALTANHRVQAHSIAAPTPLQARSTPSMFSNAIHGSSFSSTASSTFKTPALPGSRLSPPPSSDIFRAPANDQPQPSLEHSQENDTASYTLPSQPGPYRIDFSAPVTDLTQDDDVYEVLESEIAAVRGRQKRGRSEVDDEGDEEDERVQYAKRFKTGQDYGRPSHAAAATDMYRRSSTSSPHEIAYPPAQQPRQHHRRTAGNPHPQTVHQNRNTNTNVNRTPNSQLLQLLKPEDFDLAAIAEAKVEKYMRLKEKGRGCKKEEWLAGADELTALYTKIFDFVKDHMTSKIQVFARLDDAVRAHGRVLEERAGLLADAEAQFVVDAGNVLGLASSRCSGCLDAPEYKSGDAPGVVYCSPKCQTSHWTAHKAQCHNLRARRRLLRVATILRAALLVHREVKFDVPMVKIELKNGVLHLYRDISADITPRPFDNRLTANVAHKEAALTHNQCTLAFALLGPLTRKLLAGIASPIETLDLQIGKPVLHTKLVEGIPGVDFGTLCCVTDSGSDPGAYTASEMTDLDWMATYYAEGLTPFARQRMKKLIDQQREGRVRFANFVSERVGEEKEFFGTAKELDGLAEEFRQKRCYHQSLPTAKRVPTAANTPVPDGDDDADRQASIEVGMERASADPAEFEAIAGLVQEKGFRGLRLFCWATRSGDWTLRICMDHFPQEQKW
ncbi:hypothetical protein C8R46DRAFT_1353406 [Mycena filopes]|nr:hypothetical protein C8R46DRAFT_1353406 [Mycena filopes]